MYLCGQSPIFVELPLGYPVNVEYHIQSQFCEGVLQLFEIERALVFVFGGVDDTRGEDGAGDVQIDDAAVGLSIAQLLYAATGQVGQQRSHPLENCGFAGCDGGVGLGVTALDLLLTHR